jgi:DNA-directed RNA polymerase specialized sigma24 family protein
VPDQREALLLSAVHDLSYEDIAVAMECRVGTVKRGRCAAGTTDRRAHPPGAGRRPDRGRNLRRLRPVMSYEDIAVAMECRVGTVKSRINRARARLAEMLGCGRETRRPAKTPSGSPISRARFWCSE